MNNMEKKISIIIPTMWMANNYLLQMLKFMDKDENIGEVIIIDNKPENCPDLSEYISKDKLVYYTAGKNLYYNPSMNIGASMSKYDIICLLNDDVIFDPFIFKFICENLTEEMGMITPSPVYFNRGSENPTLVKNLELRKLEKLEDGMGCAMFLYRKNYATIPEELTHHFGDGFVLFSQIKNNRTNYTLHNWVIITPMRVTTNAVPEVQAVIAKDWRVVDEVFARYGMQNKL